MKHKGVRISNNFITPVPVTDLVYVAHIEGPISEGTPIMRHGVWHSWFPSPGIPGRHRLTSIAELRSYTRTKR